MTKLLNWLKGLFTHTREKNEMTDQVVEVPAVSTEQPVATPAAEVKNGVTDFEAALAFVESGVAQLGEAAKDELKALAKKYL